MMKKIAKINCGLNRDFYDRKYENAIRVLNSISMFRSLQQYIPGPFEFLCGIQDLQKIVFDYIGPISDNIIAKIMCCCANEEMVKTIINTYGIDLESILMANFKDVFIYSNVDINLLPLGAYLRHLHYHNKILFLSPDLLHQEQAERMINQVESLQFWAPTFHFLRRGSMFEVNFTFSLADYWISISDIERQEKLNNYDVICMHGTQFFEIPASCKGIVLIQQFNK